MGEQQMKYRWCPGVVLLVAWAPSVAQGGDAVQSRWSPKAAAAYLDERADFWFSWSGAARGQGTACFSCHTSLPIALARPSLREALGESQAGKVEKKMMDNLAKRVENWDTIASDEANVKNPFVPYYAKNRKPSALGTEAVLNALILANNDARRNKGALTDVTKKAMSRLWEQQKDNGAWLWLNFGLNPWENDGAYYGASLAAVAVGMAGKDYYAQAGVEAKVAALKKYLNTESAKQLLHHRTLTLWASSMLPGVLADTDKKKLIEELLSGQEADGGWSLPKLGKSANGSWKSHDVYPQGSISDGYATGLVVLSLKRAGLASDHPKLQRGINWLVANQKDGSWPASYLNRKRDPQENVGKFMRDAATAFAVMALTVKVAVDR
jgi:squalene-hopene/tetraprenyl-beta-curcumene cyclase